MNSKFYVVIKNVFGYGIIVLTSIVWTDFNGEFNYLDLKVTSEKSEKLRERPLPRSASVFSSSENGPLGTNVSAI